MARSEQDYEASAVEPLESNRSLGAVVRTESSALHAGPLPHPDQFRQYEETLPGAADRILTMAEQESQHRQLMERSVLDLEEASIELQREVTREEIAQSRLGLVIGAFISVILVVTALVVAVIGHPWPAVVIGTADIVALASIFVYGARTRSIDQDSPEIVGEGNEE